MKHFLLTLELNSSHKKKIIIVINKDKLASRGHAIIRLKFLYRMNPTIFLVITVYVFLGEAHNLNSFMTTMQMMRLFSKGEYMVISVDWETYSTERARDYLWS